MGSTPSIKGTIGELQKESYIPLLAKLIGEAESVQNNPPDGLIPIEDNVGRHVLDALNPYSTNNGGPLIIKRVSYDDKDERGHLIITYPGTDSKKVISFVGSHMDVVPANAHDDSWVRFYY